ncbi:hypothetical protein R3P38DRAFT_2597335 [Favolaschia claudopus]|uniref:F-box domain-containing protein n=1 Tax=Favolaschia claudopus TaxID=2862362 RepID=A0AAW0EDQ8_9AGAR
MSALTILSLPNELLIAIAAAGQEDTRSHSPTAQKSEWILSRLCRRLRNTVVGAPTLWTNIEGSRDYFNTPGHRVRRSGEILRLYLHRSIPLNVAVSLRIVAGVDSETLADWIIQVAAEINRVESLSVVLASAQNEFTEEFAPLRCLAAPNLLHLEIANISTTSRQRCPLELFSAGAPKLSCVRMYGFFPSPVPPWVSTLTHLKIENESRQLFHTSADRRIYLSLIRTQPISLVHLHLDISMNFNTLPTDYQIHIPSLEFFAVHVDDTEGQEYLRDIMDFVDCPALTELVVIGSHGDQFLLVLNMSRFPRVSFPVLRALSLINLDEDGCSCEQDMPHPIRTISSHATPLFPALSSLAIINHCFTPQLVKEIMGPEALPWPSLRTLTLCPSENISGVRSAVGDAVRQSPQSIPILRLSPALLFPSDWVEGPLDAIEVVDLEEVVKPFSGYWRA